MGRVCRCVLGAAPRRMRTIGAPPAGPPVAVRPAITALGMGRALFLLAVLLYGTCAAELRAADSTLSARPDAAPLAGAQSSGDADSALQRGQGQVFSSCGCASHAPHDRAGGLQQHAHVLSINESGAAPSDSVSRSQNVQDDALRWRMAATAVDTAGANISVDSRFEGLASSFATEESAGVDEPIGESVPFDTERAALFPSNIDKRSSIDDQLAQHASIASGLQKLDAAFGAQPETDSGLRNAVILNDGSDQSKMPEGSEDALDSTPQQSSLDDETQEWTVQSAEGEADERFAETLRAQLLRRVGPRLRARGGEDVPTAEPAPLLLAFRYEGRVYALRLTAQRSLLSDDTRVRLHGASTRESGVSGDAYLVDELVVASDDGSLGRKAVRGGRAAGRLDAASLLARAGQSGVEAVRQPFGVFYVDTAEGAQGVSVRGGLTHGGRHMLVRASGRGPADVVVEASPGEFPHGTRCGTDALRFNASPTGALSEYARAHQRALVLGDSAVSSLFGDSSISSLVGGSSTSTLVGAKGAAHIQGMETGHTTDVGAAEKGRGRATGGRSTPPGAAQADDACEALRAAGERVLHVGVVVDCTYAAKLGGDAAKIRAAVIHNFGQVSAIFKKAFNIAVGIISIDVMLECEDSRTASAGVQQTTVRAARAQGDAPAAMVSAQAMRDAYAAAEAQAKRDALVAAITDAISELDEPSPINLGGGAAVGTHTHIGVPEESSSDSASLDLIDVPSPGGAKGASRHMGQANKRTDPQKGEARLGYEVRGFGMGTRANFMWNLSCAHRIGMDARLRAFTAWRGTQPRDAGLYHLLTACNDGDVVGLAWIGQACQTRPFVDAAGETVGGTSMSAIIANEYSVIGHEALHALGARHDCDASTCAALPLAAGLRGAQPLVFAGHFVSSAPSTECCRCVSASDGCDCGGKYIMNAVSAGLDLRTLSPCTLDDLCRKIPVTVAPCLALPSARPTLTMNECGNGIREGDEECDCGDDAACAASPCCMAGCKLRPGAACADENDRCCAGCQIVAKDKALVCAKARTLCQRDAVCDGASRDCPRPEHVADGAPCEAPGAACASGVCTSRALQCAAIAGRQGLTEACDGGATALIAAGVDPCRITCRAPASARCTVMDAHYIDGTPCGVAGRCVAGSCSEPAVSTLARANAATLALVLGAVLLVALCVVLRCILSRPRAAPRRGASSRRATAPGR